MANKNVDMLLTFTKAMLGHAKTIKRVIPDMYFHSIYGEDLYKTLQQNGISNIICDIDNTIIEVGEINVPEKLKTILQTKSQEFNFCLVSNNSHERVNPLKEALELPMLARADKPHAIAFDKAFELLGPGATKENTVMIGDQMLTDILGAHDYGLKACLLDPVNDDVHDIKTKTSSILQKQMIRKFTKYGLFNNSDYFGIREEK